jgi:anthranilate synthase component I
MIVQPDYDQFAKAYDQGLNQIVSTRLVADLETPVSAMLKLTRNARYSFLLESVEGGAVRGRYSIIGMNPDLIWKVQDGKAMVNRTAGANPDGPFEDQAQEPLQALRALLAESRIKLPEDAPPMAAGVFGYMGYDMVRFMEELPPPKEDALGVPDGMMIRPTVMAIFDSVKDEVTVTSPVYAERGVSSRAAYSRAQERLSEIVDALDRPLDHVAMRGENAPPVNPTKSNTTPEEYKAMVMKAKDLIAAGDIFQVVLSQRFETEFTLPPFSLYRSLRRVNPSPFLVFLNFEKFAVVFKPRNSGAGARRQGDDPAHCRNPQARRHSGRGP